MKYMLSAIVLTGATMGFALMPGNTGDVNDPLYPYVGTWGGASGVLVGPDLVLTAKHVGVNNGSTFTLPGIGSFGVVANTVVDTPTGDLTLVRINATLPNWVRVTSTTAVNKSVIMVGFGQSGSLRGDGLGYDLNVAGGVRRAGVGFVEGKEDVSFSGNPPFFRSIYSPLRSNGQAALGGGDSGGAWLMQEGNELRLVGINSWVGTFGNAINYNFSQDPNNFFASGAVSLEDNVGWLKQNGVEVVPEPVSMIALGFGVLAMARRRRKN